MSMRRTKRRDSDDSAAALAVPRPGHWADPLDTLQVENLHRITPTLYRSAQPRIANVAALKALASAPS